MEDKDYGDAVPEKEVLGLVTPEMHAQPCPDTSTQKGKGHEGPVEKYWGYFFCFILFCIFAL